MKNASYRLGKNILKIYKTKDSYSENIKNSYESIMKREKTEVGNDLNMKPCLMCHHQ